MWTAYLITSLDRVRNGDVYRLVSSLPIGKIKFVVGCRGFNPESVELPDGVYVKLPERISLSEARNRLLESVHPGDTDFAFFPDDDCWLPEKFLMVAEQWLQDFDFVVGVIDTDKTEFARKGIGKLIDTEIALQRAASAALFFRSSVLANFKFDARLGLGARFRAGEDLDLVLTLLQEGKKGVWSPDLRIGHPKKDRGLEYFPGSIAALKLNSHKNPLLLFLGLRRLAHGCIFLLQRKLTLTDLRLGFHAIFLRSRDK